MHSLQLAADTAAPLADSIEAIIVAPVAVAAVVVSRAVIGELVEMVREQPQASLMM